MRKRLTEQNIVDRAAAREKLYNTFTAAYENHQRDLGKWALFFILMFALIASLPFVAWMYGLVSPK